MAVGRSPEANSLSAPGCLPPPGRSPARQRDRAGSGHRWCAKMAGPRIERESGHRSSDQEPGADAGGMHPRGGACVRSGAVFRAAFQVGRGDRGADRAVADAVVPAPGRLPAALVLEGGGGDVFPRIAAVGNRAGRRGRGALRCLPAGRPTRGDRQRLPAVFRRVAAGQRRGGAAASVHGVVPQHAGRDGAGEPGHGPLRAVAETPERASGERLTYPKSGRPALHIYLCAFSRTCCRSGAWGRGR